MRAYQRSLIAVSVVLLTASTAPPAKNSGSAAECAGVSPTVAQLESLAKKSKSQQDFLQSLPKGSFQQFTLVYNSRSMQRGSGQGQVSPIWPRVLRISADGKTMISYVCNPKSTAMGTVEVISLEGAPGNQRVGTADLDFRGPQGQVDPQPHSCTGCHAGSNVNGQQLLKYNWPEYSSWGDCQADRGISIYGSMDDSLGTDFRPRYATSPDKVPAGCTNAKDQAQHAQEVADYQKFRQTQKNNACFNTLPWPSPTTPNADIFPYSPTDKSEDYSRRPNDLITHFLSQNTGEQLYSVISSDKRFGLIKYYLAMEAAQCLTPADLPDIQRLLPGIDYSSVSTGPVNFETPDIRPSQALLMAFARYIGLGNQDFSLQFKDAQTPDYDTALTLGDSHVINIPEIISTDVIHQLAAEDPAVKGATQQAFNRNLDLDPSYLPHTKCFASVMGAFDPAEASSNFCSVLRVENEKNLTALGALGTPAQNGTEGTSGAGAPKAL